MSTPTPQFQARVTRVGGPANMPAMAAIRLFAPQFIGMLALARVVLVVGMIGLSIKAVMSSRERATILEQWPAVRAIVRHCKVDRYYPFNKSGGGVNLSIACDLAFTAGGREYVSSITPPPVRVGTHQWDSARPAFRGVDADLETSIEWWVKRHVPGSTVTVRYDPAHLPTLSVVGSGTPLDFDPVPGAWRGSATFAALAVFMSVAIRYMRGMKQNDAATA